MAIEEDVRQAYEFWKALVSGRRRIYGDAESLEEKAKQSASELKRTKNRLHDPCLKYLVAAKAYVHEERMKRFAECLKQAAYWCRKSTLRTEARHLTVLAQNPEQAYELASADQKMDFYLEENIEINFEKLDDIDVEDGEVCIPAWRLPKKGLVLLVDKSHVNRALPTGEQYLVLKARDTDLRRFIRYLKQKRKTRKK